ncbi:hypothetical protein IE4771_PE00117 (plasmid) [Rhizobium etli bv. mimosae str. IE4771]|uniref:Uncharacterized protein n=1 Tax=Rhizobium etli bv. mimosae str. IE4771 TaxID=1432050 RepID=A0A060I8Q0_RHIET|nr:hypothetical protein IE4771_PE00117 [Rhizobium sp. IE4771]ARQ62165.1 hypothetical protein Kim5_PD00157 [Rhizobium sp. Kim5]
MTELKSGSAAVWWSDDAGSVDQTRRITMAMRPGGKRPDVSYSAKETANSAKMMSFLIFD